MRHIVAAAAAALLLCPAGAWAQATVVLPQVQNAGGQRVPSQASVLAGSDGVEKGTSANPLPTVVPRATSTVVSGSVAVAGTYQLVLMANASRLGCVVQNTGTATLRVFLGPLASASDAAALRIPPGGRLECATGAVVLTDQISITADMAGATYVVVSQ